jgi:hypothetical protein
MTFVYALCSYAKTPLAEYNSRPESKCPEIARDILNRLEFNDARLNFDRDDLVFSCLSEESKLSVIIASERSVIPASRNGALDQIRTAFASKYLSTMAKANPLSKSQEFSRTIEKTFQEWSGPTAARLAAIRANLSQSETSMTQNLTNALERTDQLRLAEDQSEGIKASALAFEKDAEQLKQTMYCQKFRTCFIVIGVLVALLALVAVIVVVVVKKKKSPSPTARARVMEDGYVND